MILHSHHEIFKAMFHSRRCLLHARIQHKQEAQTWSCQCNRTENYNTARLCLQHRFKIHSEARIKGSHLQKLFLSRLSLKEISLSRSGTATGTHVYTPTFAHTHTQGREERGLFFFFSSCALSNKHGGRHKAVPAVDIGGLVMVVLGVTVCAHVGRRDLTVSGIIPATGGSRVIMLPLFFTGILLIMVGVQVLSATRQQDNKTPSSSK